MNNEDKISFAHGNQGRNFGFIRYFHPLPSPPLLPQLLLQKLLVRIYSSIVIEKAYTRGRKIAIKETGLDSSTFPENCPYTLGQIRDPEFLPT